MASKLLIVTLIVLLVVQSTKQIQQNSSLRKASNLKKFTNDKATKNDLKQIIFQINSGEKQQQQSVDEAIENAFGFIDNNNAGFIDFNQVVNGLQQVSQYLKVQTPSQDQIQSNFNLNAVKDPNDDQFKLNKEGWKNFIHQFPYIIEAIQNALQQDQNQNNSQHSGENQSPKTVDEVIQQGFDYGDTNKDGWISYQEVYSKIQQGTSYWNYPMPSDQDMQNHFNNFAVDMGNQQLGINRQNWSQFCYSFPNIIQAISNHLSSQQGQNNNQQQQNQQHQPKNVDEVIQQGFDHNDKNQDGWISLQEVQEGIQQGANYFKYPMPSDQDIQTHFNNFAVDLGNQSLGINRQNWSAFCYSFPEIIQAIQNSLQQNNNNPQNNQQYNYNYQSSGPLNLEEQEAVFKMVDQNQDGSVDFYEFQKFLNQLNDNAQYLRNKFNLFNIGECRINSNNNNNGSDNNNYNNNNNDNNDNQNSTSYNNSNNNNFNGSEYQQLLEGQKSGSQIKNQIKKQ